uniref:Reverse transcriptase domain-containing protein n=1 Tax=Tanacetum cinerariifolium TaxID=118510 RepID=A0A6L2NJV2_TANCI|nr:hypothetical protein [Tanacetum cinerariifolium]
MARLCPKPKRRRDATWFRDKALLVKAQGKGKVLNEEELEFLADPGIVEGPITQTVITNNSAYQADNLDAYDSNYDDFSIAKAEAVVSSQHWKPPIFFDDDDEESSIPLRDIISELPLSVAIAPDLLITDSLIMEDEHLNTIPNTKSDEENESSVKDLNLTPSESEDLSNNKSECDVSVCDDSSPKFTNFSNHLFDSNDDFTYSDDESFSEEDVPKENFKIYSNPLFEFDEEIISSKIDPLYNEIDSIPQGNDNDYFNVESDLIESLLNRDTLMVYSPKIDSLLEEFFDELAHINLIPSGINEANFNPEEDICLIEKLLNDNSSPRPPKELNSKIFDVIIESFSPSPIPVEDIDYLMEEINIFLAPDDSIPPGIKNDDYDSKGDNLFLEELLTNNSLPENKSFYFDIYYVPSSPRPPEKPPDDDGIYFDIEPDMGVLTAKVFNHGILASKEDNV